MGSVLNTVPTLGVVTKTTKETYPVGYDYTGKLPTGETPDSGTFTVYRRGTTDDESVNIMTDTNASVSGNNVSGLLAAAGVDGVDYQVDLLVTTTPSAYKVQETFLLRVRD